MMIYPIIPKLKIMNNLYLQNNVAHIIYPHTAHQ